MIIFQTLNGEPEHSFPLDEGTELSGNGELKP